MVRNQVLYLGIFFLIAGCGVPEVSKSANGNFPPQKLHGIISKNDEAFFKISDGVFKPRDEEHLAFFGEFNLSEDDVNEKQLTFYYITGNKTDTVKLSIPLKLFKNGSICLPVSSQYQLCAETQTDEQEQQKEIRFKQIVESKENPLVFKRVPTFEDSRNTYLIVVSPTSVFHNEMGTLIQRGLKTFFTAYKSDYQNTAQLAPDFKLLKTISGRIISSAILTKEKLLSGFNGQNELESFINENLQFTVVDWRPVRDLALVESQIDDELPKAILYITGNDGFSNFDSVPRNQCIPLAWKRDDIDLWIITNEDCSVWEKQLDVQHCLELNGLITDKEGVFLETEKENILNQFNIFMKQFFSAK